MGQIPVSWQFDGSGIGVASGAATRRTLACTYDFAAVGGGTGSYAIGGVASGAKILGGWMEVIATPTAAAGTPTIAVSVEAANDIQTAISILGQPWATVGKKAITPKVNTPESSSITTTAARSVTVAIATAAITTGKFTVFLDVMG